MTFRRPLATPLFFLPRPLWVALAKQCLWGENWQSHIGTLVFACFSRIGITFSWKGDEVIWEWPWRREGRAPYISVLFSGTGEFGDARYWTLGELDANWEEYFKMDEARNGGTQPEAKVK